MKSPVITLAELNTVYKDLIDRINVASVYNFKGEISTINDLKMLDSASMFTDNDKSTFVTLNPGDIFELDIGDGTEDTNVDVNIDFANDLNLQRHDNIVCKQTIDSTLRNTIRNNGGFSTNLDDTYYWGNYWTEVGSYMQLADRDHNGFVSTDTQEFKGDKTFLDTVKVTKTLTVEGGGTVSTSTLNITGGEVGITKSLTTDRLNVSGTTTVETLDGVGTTLTVKSGGTTTVNTIDGIDNNGVKDYADFNVSGTVTCRDFTATDQTIVANTAESKISNIDNTSAILNASRIISCTDFTATNQKITANTAESRISNIDNTSAVLKASGNILCLDFDASEQNINAKTLPSTISNINTGTGVLYISGDSIKCKTFDAEGQIITAKTAESILKNISSTKATLSGVSSVTCGNLDLGSYKLTVNDATTFSSVSTSPALSMTGTLTCGDVTLQNASGTKMGLNVNSETTLSSISGSPTIATSGNITCGDFNNGSYKINTSNETTFSKITSSSTTELNVSGNVSCKDFSNTTGTIKNTSTGDTTFSNITGNGILNVSGTLNCGNLYFSDGVGTVRVPKVELGNGSSNVPISYVASSSSDENTEGYANSIVIGTNGTNKTTRGDLIVRGHIFAGKVHNAVWNDLVDCIPVNEDAQLEYGYCYSFDGEKYNKSNKHCDPQFIGIHSDTSGMRMGERPCKTLDVAISGFVLAYVDSYKPGTPLVCGKNGKLEKATIFDKIFRPYRIIATYWKDEKEEEYGPKSSSVKVNGRNWIKIK